jgi:hypothetical protein
VEGIIAASHFVSFVLFEASAAIKLYLVEFVSIDSLIYIKAEDKGR